MTDKNEKYPPHTHNVIDILGLGSLLNTKSNHDHSHSFMSLEGFQERFRTLPVHAQRSFENLVRFLIQPEIKIEIFPKKDKCILQAQFISTHGYSMSTIKINLRFRQREESIWKEAFSKNFVNGILQYQFILDVLNSNKAYEYEVYLTDLNNPSLHCRKHGTFNTES